MFSFINDKKYFLLIAVIFAIVINIYTKIQIRTYYPEVISLNELMDTTTWYYISTMHMLMALSYPIWMSIIFIMNFKKNSSIINLIKNISYIIPIILVFIIVVTFLFSFTYPNMQIIYSESWVLLADIAVSFLVSIVWIGILSIIKLFFKTDWIVVLLSVILFYFHVLLDISLINPFIEKVFNISVGDAILFNMFGVNGHSEDVYYLFARLLLMVVFYYSLYYLLNYIVKSLFSNVYK